MKDDIIRMAREANLGFLFEDRLLVHDELQCFAALVADAEAKRMHDEGMVTVGHMRQQIAAEREACAKVAFNAKTYIEAAAAIRARGQA
jgi:hypothetical protein